MLVVVVVVEELKSVNAACPVERGPGAVTLVGLLVFVAP